MRNSALQVEYHKLALRLRLFHNYNAFFDRLHGTSWYRNLFSAWCELLPVEMNSTNLDLGCGPGAMTELLAKKSQHLIGIDTNHQSFHYAKKRSPSSNFIQASVFSLPFPSESFDLIVAASLFNLLDDPSAAVEEVSRVCKIHGHISLLCPTPDMSIEKAKHYCQTYSINAYESAFLHLWAAFAPKCTVDTALSWLDSPNLTEQQSIPLLDGMCIAVSATKLEQ